MSVIQSFFLINEGVVIYERIKIILLHVSNSKKFFFN